MPWPTFILSSILWFSIFLSAGRSIGAYAAGNGQWALLQKSIGITAMHMQLLHNDRVVIFDRTDFGRSNISLADGKCRNDSSEMVLKNDCTAHSVEYNVYPNSYRPLMVQTDVWCSSGAVAPDGLLIQTGGFNDGERVIRKFQPCPNCDWEELGRGLLARRWYATNHILPDGSVIVIGGRRQFNYEFYPKSPVTATAPVYLSLLRQTNDKEENNLYPFVHLNVDGNLFIFANNHSILFDYRKNLVVKTYPVMPGGHPRNYPSTGSSVLLPVRNPTEAEVLICGGAPRGSFPQAAGGNFIAALDTCGRMKITDERPIWTMETMPLGRVMGDMIMLPNGHVLLINGAGTGAAGWNNGREPVLNPVLYRPDNPVGFRFEVQNPTTIPRLYHSTAILLRDGRVLVGGSNPHVYYNFTDVLYPTELSLEAFSPAYLDPEFSNVRPKITRIVSPTRQIQLHYGQRFIIRFTVLGAIDENAVSVTMVAPSFTTHSFSMNQRALVLYSAKPKTVSAAATSYQVVATAPGSAFIAPPGYYMVFVNHQDIPSEGRWVQMLQ
ncbi:(methyl)glyoxal oxidase [Ranunculus cassubicifolius]